MIKTITISVALLLSAPALAQAPASNAINLFGTLKSIDASAATVETDGGKTESFSLAPDLLVLQNRSVTLADIKPGDFIASAAMRGPDGKLHSTELRIFPEALRGLGEGQRAMNDARGQTMTNATVTGTAIAGGSNSLKVAFTGGASELVLDPDVPVTRIEKVGREALRPGLSVRIQGAREATGSRATRITIQ